MSAKQGAIALRRAFAASIMAASPPPLAIGRDNTNLGYSVRPFEKRRNTTRTSIGKRGFGTTSTADGMRGFFEWLERSYGARFGGRPLPMDAATDTGTSHQNNDGSKNIDKTQNRLVVCRDSLELEDLERLFQHEISVLKVRSFYPKNASSNLGKKLALEGESARAQNWKVSTSRGLESSDVVTVGRHAPYNIAVANQAQDEYFQEVRNELRDRRGLTRDEENENEDEITKKQPLSPELWPLDLLRLELDELWPSGAGLARANHEASHKHCMGGGLPRLMVGPTRWKKGLVHVDELAPLDETRGCFSANIYLQLPYRTREDDIGNSSEQKEQPAMEVWPLGIRSKWDWYRVGLSCVLFPRCFIGIFDFIFQQFIFCLWNFFPYCSFRHR